jgi:hypothetical protein
MVEFSAFIKECSKIETEKQTKVKANSDVGERDVSSVLSLISHMMGKTEYLTVKQNLIALHRTALHCTTIKP